VNNCEGQTDGSVIQNFMPTTKSAITGTYPQIRMKDGWLVDEEGNLLIWVPNEYRNSLWWPGMHLLIGGRDPSIAIDFQGACYGSDWLQILAEVDAGERD